MIKKARENCDYLIVAVHDDKLQSKGVDFAYTLEQRMEMVGSLKFVDEVIPYERVDLLLEKVDFDVFIHGPDQAHQYFQKAFEYCRNHQKGIKQLERTQGISSTMLRSVLNKKEV